MQPAPLNWPPALTVTEPTVRVDIGDVDGPRTDVEPTSWSTRREIATYLPEQVRGISGQSVASASAEIPSAAVVTQQARNPFSKTSSRVVETACAIRAGFIGIDGRPSTVPVFTGQVMEAHGSALDDVMPVDCDDNAAELRRDVIVAPLASQMNYVPDSGSSVLLFPGVSGSYVMDAALRQLGYLTMPGLTTWATISVPLQGTLWPQARLAGSSVSATASVGDLIQARNGLATDAPVFVSRQWPTGERFLAWTGPFVARYKPQFTTAIADIRVHGWCDGDSGETEILLQSTSASWLRIRIRPGELEVAANDAGTPTHVYTTWPGGAFSVSAQQIFSGALHTALFWQGGSDNATIATTFSWGGDLDYAQVTTADGMALAGLQIGSRGLQGMLDMADFVPSASLDPTVGVIQATPGLIRADAWTVLRQIAEAEMGAVWLDERGSPTFRNRHSLRGIDEPVHPITSRTSLLDLAWRESVEQVRSLVRVPVRPVISLRADTPVHTVYTAGDEDRIVTVGALSTKTMSVRLNGMAIGVDTNPARTVVSSRSRFLANTSPDGSGTDVTASVQVEIDPSGPRRARITIHNNFADRIYLVNEFGQPALFVRARQRIVQYDNSDEFVEVDNNGVDGDELELDSSPWIQVDSSALDLASFLAAELAQPRPILERVPVAWDPRRQLGDIVEVSDPDVTGLEPMRGVVVAIEHGGTAGDIEQHLDIRPLLPTLAEFNAAWAGQTIADINAFWAGQTIADLNADPLKVS